MLLINSIGVSDFLSNGVYGLDNGVGVNISGCVKELSDILDMLGQLDELWDSQCLLGILFLIFIWLVRSFLYFLIIEGGGENGRVHQ